MPIPDTNSDQEEVFFVIKQEFFDTKREFEYASDFYQKVKMFTNSALQQSYKIKYTDIWPFSQSGDYEVVVIFQYGEPAKILLDGIQ